MLRPERLRLINGAQDECWNRFSGVVEEIVYQGEGVLLSVELAGGGTVFIRQPTDQQTLAALPDRGQQVEVGLHETDTLIVPDSDVP